MRHNHWARLFMTLSIMLILDRSQCYINLSASPFRLVRTGRIFIGVFVVTGCVTAPLLANNSSEFEFIQKFQGYVSTGILAVFIYGLLNRTSAQ